MPPKYVTVRVKAKTAEELFGIRPTPAKTKTAFYVPPVKAKVQFKPQYGNVNAARKGMHNNTYKLVPTKAQRDRNAVEDARMRSYYQ